MAKVISWALAWALSLRICTRALRGQPSLILLWVLEGTQCRYNYSDHKKSLNEPVKVIVLLADGAAGVQQGALTTMT